VGEIDVNDKGVAFINAVKVQCQPKDNNKDNNDNNPKGEPKKEQPEDDGLPF